MICLLFGPPGCGKGTQARLLSRTLGIPALSTGDLLRAAAEEPTTAGRALKQHLAAGGFATDDMVNSIVRRRLVTGRAELILDGYPRTVSQAIYFDHLLATLSLPAPIALQIDVDPQDLVQRLAARRYCPQCLRVFSLAVHPPARAGYCDDCAAPLAQREDDSAETVLRRLEIYREVTAPVLSHYRRGSWHAFPGNQPAAELARQIQAVLGSRPAFAAAMTTSR